ncbi:hypothetical protein D3C81_1135820 [compost metagenome]
MTHQVSHAGRAAAAVATQVEDQRIRPCHERHRRRVRRSDEFRTAEAAQLDIADVAGKAFDLLDIIAAPGGLVAPFVNLGAAGHFGGTAALTKTFVKRGAEMQVTAQFPQVLRQRRTEGLHAGGGCIASFGIFPGDRTADPFGHRWLDVIRVHFHCQCLHDRRAIGRVQGGVLRRKGVQRQQRAQYDCCGKLLST